MRLNSCQLHFMGVSWVSSALENNRIHLGNSKGKFRKVSLEQGKRSFILGAETCIVS